MRLRHIHLPNLTPYPLAAHLQEHLRRALLTAKDAPPSSSSPPPPHPSPPPPPTLISFVPPPTYTLGRRQTTPLSPRAISRLTAPLTTPSSGTFRPDLISSPRGGLTTYHGPGQLVLWPVVDIRSSLYRQFGVRGYACLLEKTTIAVLAALFGLEGFTTADPGVWVRSGADGVERKVAAMGVHLRRHVTSLGTAVNLDFPGEKDEGVNPWARFVPCGLEGKEATSVAREVEGTAVGLASEEDVARAWAEEFARRIGVEGVERGRVGGGELMMGSLVMIIRC
ncbi:lipoyltransferase [Coniochaeta ligniaria NRRL 30616]|uniref:Octanoyltransferase n=1 Tax=Coniochaeta ligniaria NRRL 30616 TaxID=1408157 RepID=A0A1J7IUM3_9PEZI|nr:lipoyltransferase [Coniochaeta ligniaria NRRL 30616]